MASLIKRQLIFMVLVTASLSVMAQNTVPMGIHYQAVARDNYGNELVNKKISVKFSVISGDPLASPVYQEVHQDITTSKFGVFSLVIGRGVPSLTPPCTSLSQIAWDQANHYLKVEVKFENDFMDMGTMQFLAVPYALYAQKSLEPGPEGPKGDKGEKGEPGDPSTDNQTLSFDGSNLTISGTTSTVNLTPLLQTLQVSNDGTGGYNMSLTRGNTINLATIEKDGDPANEIQDLTLNSNKLKITKNSNATEWDLSPYLDNTDGQSLSWDPVNRILGISGSTKTISLRELESDADSSITNEIQDLQLVDNKLSITGKAGAKEVNMNTYLDNTDNQTLTFTEASNTLAVSGGNSVNLGVLRDNTDNQTLSFTETSNTLSVTGGNTVNLTALRDNTDSQMLTFTEASSTLAVSGGNSVNLAALKDNTDSQTLTFTEGTNKLTISGGNEVTIGSLVAFRAKKTSSETVTTWMTDYDFITNPPEYNDGGGFDYESGVFTAPTAGIYIFSINYTATGSGNSRALRIFLNGSLYETLNTEISNGSIITRQITMKLAGGNHVNLKINVGTGYDTGTGTFSGFKVY